MIQLSVKLFLQAEDTFSFRSLLLYGTIYLLHNIITQQSYLSDAPTENYGSDPSGWYCFFDNGIWITEIYMTEQIGILLYVPPIRSEEHSSELLSRGHLVLRLLLDTHKS